MESVESIAQKLIPCTCGGYGENNRRHMSDCPRFLVAWEDIAAALRAERANTDTANSAAVTAYAKVRELEALLAGAKAAVLAERAKFAAVNERLRKVLDRIAYGPFGGPEASASDLLGSITDFAREALTTNQAAEDAAGGKK